jgi:hypothetical protein
MPVSRRMNPARVVRVGHVQRGSFFSEKCIMHSRSGQSCVSILYICPYHTDEQGEHYMISVGSSCGSSTRASRRLSKRALI